MRRLSQTQVHPTVSLSRRFVLSPVDALIDLVVGCLVANYDVDILSKSPADARRPLKTDSAIQTGKPFGSLVVIDSIALGVNTNIRSITSSAPIRSKHMPAILFKCRRWMSFATVVRLTTFKKAQAIDL